MHSKNNKEYRIAEGVFGNYVLHIAVLLLLLFTVYCLLQVPDVYIG
jgi:hypothetical protein